MTFLAIVGFTAPNDNLALVELKVRNVENANDARNKARRQFRNRFGFRHIESIDVIPVM